MIARSGLTKSPPLKPAIGVSSLRASNSMAMPMGGRPLVMAKRIPAARKLCTAAWARSVRTFCSVTSVPSTSASTRESLRFSAIGTSTVRSFEGAPGAAIARQQFVRRGRAVPAGDIAWNILGRIVCPGVQDGLHRAPARLDIVGPLEQRGVADHAVIDQRLVARTGRHVEIGLVGEVHADVA